MIGWVRTYHADATSRKMHISGIQFGTGQARACVYIFSLFNWWKYTETFDYDYIHLSLRVTWLQMSYFRRIDSDVPIT